MYNQRFTCHHPIVNVWKEFYTSHGWNISYLNPWSNKVHFPKCSSLTTTTKMTIFPLFLWLMGFVTVIFSRIDNFRDVWSNSLKNQRSENFQEKLVFTEWLTMAKIGTPNKSFFFFFSFFSFSMHPTGFTCIYEEKIREKCMSF